MAKLSMSKDEIQEQIELYTRRLELASTDFEKESATKLIAVWEATLVKHDADQLAKRNSPDRVEKRLAKLKKNVEGLGIEWSKWEAWAHGLYETTRQPNGRLLVKSHARDWQKEVSWEVDCDVDAMCKVYQLVVYKINDRKRGSGDVLKDLGLAA